MDNRVIIIGNGILSVLFFLMAISSGSDAILFATCVLASLICDAIATIVYVIDKK